MERVKLTSERIRKLECPPGKQQAFLWDEDVKQLAVRVTATGSKAFIYQGWINQGALRITLGDTQTWDLDKARPEARRLQTLVDQGIDPRDQRREQEAKRQARKDAAILAEMEAEHRKRYTLRALCEAYTDTLKAAKRPAFKDASSLFRVNVYPTKTADKPARDVTDEEIAEIISRVHESGRERTAGALRSYLHRVYQVAIASRLDPKQPASLKAFGLRANPVSAIPTIPTKARSRTLSPDELKAYLAALGDTLHVNVLRLALYSGSQRMSQLLRATVADWDGERLRLFDPKGRRQTPREHLLPLGRKAAAILDDLAALAKQRSTSMLFSTYGTRRLSEDTISKRVTEISKALGGESFDLRDIRRTTETMLAGMDVNRDIRAQLLSHGISGVQAMHYDRHDYLKEKAAALAKWERRLDEIEKGKKPAKVVPLHK